MYKLEITESEIIGSINDHISNIGNIGEIEANNIDAKLIREFANNVNIFYDDDLMGIFEKYYKEDKDHHSYRVLVTRGKFRLWTEISIPQNSFCYENFSLSSVMIALRFEVSDPSEYMEESEDSPIFKKAVKRYKKNSDKIFSEFGEDFYSCILGGSY